MRSKHYRNDDDVPKTRGPSSILPHPDYLLEICLFSIKFFVYLVRDASVLRFLLHLSRFIMNKILILLSVMLFLACPVVSRAADDPFDTGQSRMTGSEALFNLGFWVLTHPDSINKLSQMSKDENQKDVNNGDGELDKKLDKKVDDAIKKAWE